MTVHKETHTAVTLPGLRLCDTKIHRTNSVRQQLSLYAAQDMEGTIVVKLFPTFIQIRGHIHWTYSVSYDILRYMCG